MMNNILNNYGGKKLNKNILQKLIDDIKNYEEPEPIGDFILNNDEIIDNIYELKNIKTQAPLSNTTYKNYVRMYNDLCYISHSNNFINDLIENKDNKTKINYLINKIKNQEWLKENRLEINEIRSLNHFRFINTLITALPLCKINLNDYVINRLNQVIKELAIKNQDHNDNKVDFDTLNIEWTEYINKVESLTENKNANKRDILLFNLYRHLPLRDDFGKIGFENMENANWYSIKDKKLYMRSYKNNHIHGEKIYKVPDYIHTLINEQFMLNKKYMITKDNGELYNNGKLTDYIRINTKKLFGKSFSIGDIRKSAVSYYQHNKSTKQQRNLADIMLHNLTTAKLIYTRNN